MQIKRQKRKITNESHKSPHHMLIKVKRNRQKNVIITRAVCLFVLSKRTNLVRSLKISRHQTPTGRTELRCTTTLKSVETLTCLKLNKHDLKIYILVECLLCTKDRIWDALRCIIHCHTRRWQRNHTLKLDQHGDLKRYRISYIRMQIQRLTWSSLTFICTKIDSLLHLYIPSWPYHSILQSKALSWFTIEEVEKNAPNSK